MYQPQHQQIGIRNCENYLSGETHSKKVLIKGNNYIGLSKSKRAIKNNAKLAQTKKPTPTILQQKSALKI